LLSADAVREEDALSSFDVVFLRYNPLREPAGEPPSPVIDFCWRLRLSGVLVVNDPEGVRRAWGRLYLADLPPEVRARTVVRVRPREIKTFLRELDGPAVLKPLAHADREKVFFLRRRQARNVNPIISAITKDGYAVAQEYLPEADAGEKRLLLLGGDPSAWAHRSRSIGGCPRRIWMALGREGSPIRAGLRLRAAVNVDSGRPNSVCATSYVPSCWPTGSTSSVWTCGRQDFGAECVRPRRHSLSARDLPH